MAHPPAFEDEPLTRPEYITAVSHFYRGEMQRSISWRQRLDATTNWAILTAAGMISFSFGNTQNTHLVILVSNLAALAFLLIEARRYRYFEVYRARVRMLEENYFLPILKRDLISPMADWHNAVAQDLDRPKFKTTILEAMGFRLRRNYGVIFSFILGGWILKILTQPTIPRSFGEIYDRVTVEPIPGWAILILGTLFYGSLFLLARHGHEIHGQMPDDEIAGVEEELDAWKI